MPGHSHSKTNVSVWRRNCHWQKLFRNKDQVVLLVTSASHTITAVAVVQQQMAVFEDCDSPLLHHNTTHHQWQFINPLQHNTPGKAVAEQQMTVFEASVSPLTHHNTTQHTRQGGGRTTNGCLWSQCQSFNPSQHNTQGKALYHGVTTEPCQSSMDVSEVWSPSTWKFSQQPQRPTAESHYWGSVIAVHITHAEIKFKLGTWSPIIMCTAMFAAQSSSTQTRITDRGLMT